MEILKSGTLVTTNSSQIKAIVTGACIRFEKVNYEISYFYNGEYKTAWLNENEFSVENAVTEKIGYK
jgi:hypothetical protein